MPNVNWQFDSDTHTFHKQTAEYDLEVGRNGLLLISDGQEVIEHIAKGPASAKSDGDYFLKHGELPEPVQEIQPYTQVQTIQQYASQNPYVDITKEDYKHKRFVLMFIAIFIVGVAVLATGGYTLISMQFSYGKHGTAIWMHTIATPIYVVVAVGTLYYLITRGFRR